LVSPHPIPLPNACLPVGRGGRGEESEDCISCKIIPMGKKIKKIKKTRPEAISDYDSKVNDQKSVQASLDSRKSLNKNKWFPLLFLLFILFIGSFLLFKNLGNQYLWQDEAQTALIAKTVLSHGIPLGYDGKNFFSQDLGADYGKNYVWRWHPWFPFYLLAGFFGIFGINTFIARLPFALFGLAIIALVYFFSRSLWMSKRAGLIAGLLLILSIPFLILSRQCRYYSPTAFFTLLGLYSYFNLTENKKYSLIALGITLMLLFHTHYVFYGIILLTIFSHAVIFYRDKVKKIFILSLLTAVINLPWIMLGSGILSEGPFAAKTLDMDESLRFFSRYLSQMTQYIYPLSMIGVSLSVVIFYKIKQKKKEDHRITNNLVLLILFINFSLIAISFFIISPFFRHLTPLIPVCCLILSLVVERCMKFHFVAGFAAIVIFAYSQPILDYFYEITHDYDGPIEGIVKYLNQNAKKSEIVAITYGDLPLKFYTDMKVVGGLTGEDLSPAKQADWVVIRKYVICEKDWVVKQYLVQNVPWHQYERITINYPDAPFENRESPQEHNYRTVTNEDKVVIYKKIR
jgi:hypothetical protein